MRRVLQTPMPGEEHMLVSSRICGRAVRILVFDTDFRVAMHGTVRKVRKEGVSVEVVHVRTKDMKDYQQAGLHHAKCLRDQAIMEWGLYKRMMRQAGGLRQTRRMWKELVAKWGVIKKEKRHQKELGRHTRKPWAGV